MKFLPTDRRSLIKVLIRWGVVVVILYGVILFITVMPGDSFEGKLQSLSQEEKLLKNNLKKHVKVLADSIGHHNIWAYKNLVQAEKYIFQQLRFGKYIPKKQVFKTHNVEVSNIELIFPGKTDEIIVIGAHYDTFGLSKGANDNTSGVAALLEIARILSEKVLNKTIHFVAFVNEEPPFFNTDGMGSLVYARNLKKNRANVYGMYSLETIGFYTEEERSQKYPFIFGWFYPSKGNFITFVGNLSSRNLVAESVEIFRENTLIPSEGTAAPGWIHGIGWSDHWSFWQCGYDALMITDTAPFRYKHYHTENDTWEKLDYENMARVVFGISTTIRAIAEK